MPIKTPINSPIENGFRKDVKDADLNMHPDVSNSIPEEFDVVSFEDNLEELKKNPSGNPDEDSNAYTTENQNKVPKNSAKKVAGFVVEKFNIGQKYACAIYAKTENTDQFAFNKEDKDLLCDSLSETIEEYGLKDINPVYVFIFTLITVLLTNLYAAHSLRSKGLAQQNYEPNGTRPNSPNKSETNNTKQENKK